MWRPGTRSWKLYTLHTGQLTCARTYMYRVPTCLQVAVVRSASKYSRSLLPLLKSLYAHVGLWQSAHCSYIGENLRSQEAGCSEQIEQLNTSCILPALSILRCCMSQPGQDFRISGFHQLSENLSAIAVHVRLSTVRVAAFHKELL